MSAEWNGYFEGVSGRGQVAAQAVLKRFWVISEVG